MGPRPSARSLRFPDTADREEVSTERSFSYMASGPGRELSAPGQGAPAMGSHRVQPGVAVSSNCRVCRTLSLEHGTGAAFPEEEN